MVRMRNRGFTLLEVLIALSLLSVAALSVAQLMVITTSALHVARLQTSTMALAASRMEELRSLAWNIDSTGNPVTDNSTNLSHEPLLSNGPGLGLSPPGSIDQNTPGFVDFLDANGRWISAGPAPPAGAAFVRRWSIETPADSSPDTLVLQVLTRPVAEDASPSTTRPSTGRGEARLISLITRVAL